MRKSGESGEEDHALSEIRADRRMCGLGLFGLSPANSAEPVKIRMSWVAPVSNWASIILEKKDLAKHLGKSYTLKSTRYQGTPQMITAIANNELEVSNLAYSSLAIAIENAGLDDLRVIADEFQDGVPGYYKQPVLRAQRQRHQQGRGPQRQGDRHQWRRQRHRYRSEPDSEKTWARRKARLHHAGRSAAGDARHAAGKEG